MTRSTNRSTPGHGDHPIPVTERYRRRVDIPGLREAGPQAPQIQRPVRKRLRRPRLIGELADSVPERSDTGAIVAEEARRLVESLNLPVDLVAHREGMLRRRPASSCDT